MFNFMSSKLPNFGSKPDPKNAQLANAALLTSPAFKTADSLPTPEGWNEQNGKYEVALDPDRAHQIINVKQKFLKEEDFPFRASNSVTLGSSSDCVKELMAERVKKFKQSDSFTAASCDNLMQDIGDRLNGIPIDSKKNTTDNYVFNAEISIEDLICHAENKDSPLFIRVVLISDTHGKHENLTLNDKELPLGDILIHCGDITMAGENSQLEGFANWFKKQPHLIKVCIGGNHDISLHKDYFYEQGASRFLGIPKDKLKPGLESYEYTTSLGEKKVKNIPNPDKLIAMMRQKCMYLDNEGFSLKINEDSTTENNPEHNPISLNFFGSPWQPWFCDWAFNAARGQNCRNIWNLIPNSTDILLTHGPPLGRGDKCGHGGRAGCLDLLKKIQIDVKPLVSAFGHIHEDYGESFDGETLFVNCSSCNLSYRAEHTPIVLDIPLERLRRKR